jgi:hypothetical protein
MRRISEWKKQRVYEWCWLLELLQRRETKELSLIKDNGIVIESCDSAGVVEKHSKGRAACLEVFRYL